MGKEKQKQSTTPHVVCDLTCYHFLISAQNKALLQNKFWYSSLLIWILCVSSGKTISWFSKPCCFSLPWTISYSHYHQDKSHFPAKTELNIHYLFFTSWRKWNVSKSAIVLQKALLKDWYTGSTYGQIFACHTTTRSYLMIALHFKILAYVTTQRFCLVFCTLCRFSHRERHRLMYA